MDRDAQSPKLRKTHTKSRLGCKQCKDRKVKCDEQKPGCKKCASNGRLCSYLDAACGTPDLPTPVSASRHSFHTAATTPSTILSTIVQGEQANALHDPALVGEQYSLLHLQLLDHLNSEFKTILCSVQPHAEGILSLAIRQALHVPYLMDQMLALAAAHKSTVVQLDQRELYRTESTRLQTRALAQVVVDPGNTPKDSDSDPSTFFFFSAFIGQHVLFDVFSSLTDLATVLDRLVHCFYLHHGIRVSASGAWEKVRTMLLSHGMLDPHSGSSIDRPDADVGTECDGLVAHLQRSDLDQQTRDVYCETVKLLQYLFDGVRLVEGRRITAVQEWPIRVSPEYIALLRERRPEALVVVAHYGVLLHHARDYWAVGDSGSFLIRSITSHLGEYWAEWLVWPNEVLIDAS